MRPRLFLVVVSAEARRLMSYRVDFWLSSLVGLVAGIVIPYFLWSSIYATSGVDRIGSFTFEAMLVYYVVVVLLGRLIQGPDLMTAVAHDIYHGELSRFLVYPTRYLPLKYAQHIGASLPGLVQLLIFGAFFVIVLEPPDDLTITLGSALRCMVSVALANALYFLLTVPLQAIAFWADNVWSLTVLLRFAASLLGGLFVPLSLFPSAAFDAIHYTPFPYLYSFPVNTLIGRVGVLEWCGGVAVVIAWCGIVLGVGKLVWRRGELQYSGVGI